MAVRTKPVRIFEGDHAPLRLLAELERRSPQEVFHAALAEYLESHRDRSQPSSPMPSARSLPATSTL